MITDHARARYNKFSNSAHGGIAHFPHDGPRRLHRQADESPRSPAPAGWRVEDDRDFSIAVPESWQSRRETGTQFVTFTGPRAASALPERIVVGWTEGVSEEDFPRVIDLFKNVQGSRTFTGQDPVTVPGARAAVLVDSRREHGPARTPIREWNLFVHTHSDVSLNPSFVAPVVIFDEAQFQAIVATVVAHERLSI